MLTTFDLDEYVVAALRAGAGGYLLKDVDPETLADAVRKVAAGDLPLAPQVLRRVVDGYLTGATPATDPRLERLTQREREVLRLLADGMTNAEISARLVVSLPTTKTQRMWRASWPSWKSATGFRQRSSPIVPALSVLV